MHPNAWLSLGLGAWTARDALGHPAVAAAEP